VTTCSSQRHPALGAGPRGICCNVGMAIGAVPEVVHRRLSVLSNSRYGQVITTSRYDEILGPVFVHLDRIGHAQQVVLHRLRMHTESEM